MAPHNRVLVVSGGTSGIGRAAIGRAVSDGYQVACLDRRLPDCDSRVGSTDYVKGVTYRQVDVRDSVALQEIFASIYECSGPIDALFINAGIMGTFAPIHLLAHDDWSKTLNVNLTGAFNTLAAATQYLRENSSVVFTASITGTRSFASPGSVAYAASKAGVDALAKVAAIELGHRNIRVNVLAPGPVATAIQQDAIRQDLDQLHHSRSSETPLYDSVTLNSLACVVLYLLSPESRPITGQTIAVDAGQSLLGGGFLTQLPEQPNDSSYLA